MPVTHTHTFMSLEVKKRPDRANIWCVWSWFPNGNFYNILGWFPWLNWLVKSLWRNETNFWHKYHTRENYILYLLEGQLYVCLHVSIHTYIHTLDRFCCYPRRSRRPMEPKREPFHVVCALYGINRKEELKIY